MLCRLALAVAASLALTAQAAEMPAVAAASDLRIAMDDIAGVFRRETGRSVKMSYGSSGNYFRQIEQGAPFELFMSADETFVSRLFAAGRTEDHGVLYATGRLVLFAPRDAAWRPDPAFEGLRAALAQSTVRRFAIANPEHAPYGRAAEQTLRKLGLWEALRPRLVLGENVAQAAQFATSGSTQGGLFAYSLVFAPGMGQQGNYVLVPAELHEPLRQRMVLVKGAGSTARALYRYLQTPTARAIFERYGFAPPK